MTVDEWYARALADANDRGLPDMAPVLQALAAAVAQLRATDPDASATSGGPSMERPPSEISDRA